MGSASNANASPATPSRIVVDVGLPLALYVPEVGTDAVQSLFAIWAEQGNELLAPDLWKYEATSVVHKDVVQHRLTEDEGRETIDRILALPIHSVQPAGLHQRAFRLASDLHLVANSGYDAHYLAIAEMENADMWTLDKRLYKAVHTRLPWVHLVGKPDTDPI